MSRAILHRATLWGLVTLLTYAAIKKLDWTTLGSFGTGWSRWVYLTVGIAELALVVGLLTPRIRLMTASFCKWSFVGAGVATLFVWLRDGTEAQCNCLGGEPLPITTGMALQGAVIIAADYIGRIRSQTPPVDSIEDVAPG